MKSNINVQRGAKLNPYMASTGQVAESPIREKPINWISPFDLFQYFKKAVTNYMNMLTVKGNLKKLGIKYTTRNFIKEATDIYCKVHVSLADGNIDQLKKLVTEQYYTVIYTFCY